MFITVYTAPEHAAKRVPLSVLIKFNIDAQISYHSYIKGKSAYLKEDRDRYLLTETVNTHDAKLAYKFNVERHDYREIRGYSTYVFGCCSYCQANKYIHIEISRLIQKRFNDDILICYNCLDKTRKSR